MPDRCPPRCTCNHLPADDGSVLSAAARLDAAGERFLNLMAERNREIDIGAILSRKERT